MALMDMAVLVVAHRCSQGGSANMAIEIEEVRLLDRFSFFGAQEERRREGK